MRPQFKFTLDGSKLIGDPIGWDEIELNLVRDKDYFSLVESVELPLTFYGNNAGIDGGYEYIKLKREAGIDSQITIEVQISLDNGETFEYFWEGVFDLTELVEIEHKRRFDCTLTRTGNWSRFMNRKAIPVDIQDTKTVDGENATSFIATAHDLTLPPQLIRQTYDALHSGDVFYTLSASGYGIIDFQEVGGFTGSNYLSEIAIKYDYPRISSDVQPFEIFSLAYGGTYTISGYLNITDSVSFPTSHVDNIEVYTQINSNTPVAWTKSNQGVDGNNGRTRFVYNASTELQKNDLIRVYFKNTDVANAHSFYWNDFETSGLTVTADTAFPQSVAPGFFIHDAGRAIVGHIVGEEYFYSDYFGGQATDIEYSDEGCGAYYRLLQGLNIRGKELTDKPFSMSFDEWWDGIDPIFNLGLGYEVVGSSEVIRVEPKEYFFDDSSNSVELDYVNNIEISYDPDYLLASVKIGYQKWKGEVSSGIDDPQTSHTYATRLKTAGGKDRKNKKIQSSLIAASLVIEQTRRQSVDIGKDWRFDEDKFIIQTTSSLSPEEVRLYSDEVITNLLNPRTRYNVRLTPASNFNRWKNVLFIAFQNYLGDVFRFTEGEGNTAMTFNNPSATGCDAEPGKSAIENGDITITGDYLFLPILYKFETPLTWAKYKAIRDNRKLSIGISYYDNQGEFRQETLFIKNLKYKINESKAEFHLWLKNSGMERFDVEIKLDVSENVTPNPSWSSTFFCVDASQILTLNNVAGSAIDGPYTFAGGSEVSATISKTNNGGIAQGNGYIYWVQQGVTVHAVNFLTGNNVALNSYTFTDVNENDIIRVEVNEG